LDFTSTSLTLLFILPFRLLLYEWVPLLHLAPTTQFEISPCNSPLIFHVLLQHTFLIDIPIQFFSHPNKLVYFLFTFFFSSNKFLTSSTFWILSWIQEPSIFSYMPHKYVSASWHVKDHSRSALTPQIHGRYHPTNVNYEQI
jgi:hypothetical protein